MRKDKRSEIHEGMEAISVLHLLHPNQHFSHPRDVVEAATLTSDEKRAILASWASDQFAVESLPGLRHLPGTDSAVSYDDILDSLKALDGVAEGAGSEPHIGSGVRPYRRRDRQRRWPGWRALLPKLA